MDKVIKFLDELIFVVTPDPDSPRDKMYKHYLSGEEAPFSFSNIEAKERIRNKIENGIKNSISEDALAERQLLNYREMSLKEQEKRYSQIDNINFSNYFHRAHGDKEDYIDTTLYMDEVREFEFIPNKEKGGVTTYTVAGEEIEENRFNTSDELYKLEVQAHQHDETTEVMFDCDKMFVLDDKRKPFESLKKNDSFYVYVEEHNSVGLEKLVVLENKDGELVFDSNGETEGGNKESYEQLSISQKEFNRLSIEQAKNELIATEKQTKKIETRINKLERGGYE